GPSTLPFLVAAAFVLGLLAPLPRLTRPRTVGLAAALVAAQLVGSARNLHTYDREQPVLDWGRDAVETIGGPDRALILTGFERWHLALLLREPWPEPFTGTWAYQRELPRTGPIPFDISVIGPSIAGEVHEFLEEGGEVYLLDTVPFHFREHPRLGPYIQEWERRYDLQPVSHGRFEAHRLLLRE
ncbi:MAG: hypothetical protein O7B99_12880, partial [Planctomycetota bacterium]|nr:hypothetical protein [Planctomycetota bacterium]